MLSEDEEIMRMDQLGAKFLELGFNREATMKLLQCDQPEVFFSQTAFLFGSRLVLRFFAVDGLAEDSDAINHAKGGTDMSFDFFVGVDGLAEDSGAMWKEWLGAKLVSCGLGIEWTSRFLRHNVSQNHEHLEVCLSLSLSLSLPLLLFHLLSLSFIFGLSLSLHAPTTFNTFR